MGSSEESKPEETSNLSGAPQSADTKGMSEKNAESKTQGAASFSIKSDPPGSSEVKANSNQTEEIRPKASYFQEALGTSTSSVPDNSSINEISSNEKTSQNSSFNSPLEGNSVKGGEWELLKGKISELWERNQLPSQMNQLIQPLRVLLGLVGLLLVVQLYGIILGTIAKFPLAPRLFELAGIIWLVKFSSNNLVRSKDREDVMTGIKSRWSKFSNGSKSDG